MSQKEEILELLKDGASYDQIETQTGAQRNYIRQTASDFRQRDKKDEISGKEGEPEDTPKVESAKEDKVLNQTDNTLEFDIQKDKDKDKKVWNEKSGLDHHKEWVAAKKYECNCGCTLNRKGDFCPHCGTSLDWSGVD